MKLHQKGFLLVELSKVTSIWDIDLINKALHEYELTGTYWINSFSITLDELASAGLIISIDNRLDYGDGLHYRRLMFKYSMTAFGRQRAQDAGLLTL